MGKPFSIKSASDILPRIGASTQVIYQPKWYKDVASLGVDTLEINRRNSKLYFNQYFLEKVGRYLDGYHLSLHSATTGIFQERESFTRAELETLTAEVDVCRFIGARELVFHLNPKRLFPANRDRLTRVLEYAGSGGVDMLFESDNPVVAETVQAVLEAFPEIGYVLDLGHLNIACGRGVLGCKMEAFLAGVRERTAYVHANNNDGSTDEHRGLNRGTLDWRRILDLLDRPRIRKVIIEVSSPEDIAQTRTDLEHYFEGN